MSKYKPRIIYLEDLNEHFDFGQYKWRDETLLDVIHSNPQYIEWCSKNMTNFLISESIFKYIEANISSFEFEYQTIAYLTYKSVVNGNRQNYLTESSIDSRWLNYVVGLVSHNKYKESWYLHLNDFDNQKVQSVIEITEAFNKLVKNSNLKISSRLYDFEETELTRVYRILRSLKALLADETNEASSINSLTLRIKTKLDRIYDFLGHSMKEELSNDVELDRKLLLGKLTEMSKDYLSRLTIRNNEWQNLEQNGEYDWLIALADSNDPDLMSGAYWNID